MVLMAAKVRKWRLLLLVGSVNILQDVQKKKFKRQYQITPYNIFDTTLVIRSHGSGHFIQP